MSYSGLEVFAMAVTLIDETLATGAINGATTAIYKARTPHILNLFQAEMMKSADMYKELNISSKPAKNILGFLTGMDYMAYEGIELIKECVGSVKQYYFEVDGAATVYVEDYNGQWNTLATVVVDDTITEFTPFKAVVTPSLNATRSRLRFSGSYRYVITNYAMFDVPVNPNKLIEFRPFVKHIMPLDFKSVDQIINEYTDRQMEKSTSYKWVSRGDLYLNYFYEGNIKISYKPIPIKITDLAQTMQVDDISVMAGAYFLAAHLVLIEDAASASFFNQRFMELKLESNIKQPSTVTQILDIYGSGFNG